MYDKNQLKSDSKKNDIMAYINKDKLNSINETFNRLGNGINLDQFIQIMLHFSENKTKEEDIEFIENVIDTFNIIDVNGNGIILWDDFSNYIVESDDNKSKNNIVNVIRNYHFCTTAKDRQKHDNDISKIYFFEAIKHLLVIENESKKILIYNYLTGGLILSFSAHSGSVLAAEYLIGQDLVCTSGSDNCLLFWDPIHNYRLVNKIPTRETQIVIRWYKPCNYLITGGFDQVVNVYKNMEFNDGKLKNSINLMSLKKMHSEMLTDILVLRKHKMMVVGDIKGIISLWNIQNLEYKDKLKDQKYRHKKGIVSLACIEDKNWLLSCGVEHIVIIWDLVVGKHIGILQGHSTSLLGVKILMGTDQIITGDVGGIFKVWDARDLSLVQTFSIPNSTNKKAHAFCVTSKHKKKIIIGSDKVYFFDYEESQEGNLADTYVCINIIYNEVFDTFITAHMKCIKVWDAKTGQLNQIFNSPTKNEISCIKLDKRKRKLFIGDIEGNIISINILNGMKMKQFTSHKKYVSAVDYFNEGKKFISASWDGTIKIHDDDSVEEKGLQLFEFSHNVPGKTNSCNSIDFSEELKILACGYDNGSITLVNMKSLSSEGTLSEHKKITFCKFLDDYPALIVCDLDCDIHFWTIILTKPKKIMKDYQFKNYSTNDNNSKESFPIKCLSFEKKNNILFMGDETGYVKAYNITEYINYIKLMLPCSKIEYDSLDLEPKKEISKELQDLKNKLLSAEKYNYLDNSPQIKINLSDLIKIKNSMDIKPVFIKEWQAHKNGISAVCCHYDPVMYITAGHDMKVHIWDENFQLIGNLTTITDNNWKVKIDIESKRKREKEFAEKKYEELKNLDFNSLFEGETKLPKLIEYTNYEVSN
jgi:WD40 repeat protein